METYRTEIPRYFLIHAKISTFINPGLREFNPRYILFQRIAPFQDFDLRSGVQSAKMPKSKRARIVHTSTVQKKPSKEKSASLYAAVRAAADTYSHVFVFNVENMRNAYLKNVRQEFNNDGRLFFGKTKVMANALGLSEEDEHMPGLSKLSGHLKGNVGLLCTDRAPEEVLKFFEEFAEVDFARAGVQAARSFMVPEGVVYSTGGEQPVEDDVPLPHSLEATVRKWGMPTRLDKGKVMLDQEYVVCKESQILDSNQTALLKMFGIAMAEFKVKILAYWSAATQEVTVVDEAAAEGVDVVLDDGMDEMEEG
ncbi:mRNA turnover and ribosome assembly protein [Vermiconidia calcicola]|uniref:mRNA turnover and ribosome assembly protein n=1 Tax=Vermiconidia calcicola TaxID=1690605 RepID=A0ACC3NSD9_9PEZI|nr:mRNA turnover and ribosome assembly protein [Vermiconidia calcicola]